MPIQLLPDSTARAIGSTIVIHDAATVVKELVDNALDANATIISVEISSNTLETIQVKDNGFGIGVEDRQLLCKRGCTSKISTIEDLELLGGSSLGFRGEALASVVEIGEGLTVITRIDSESVGCVLKYGKAGALLSSASASHPVGTTVRVTNLLQLVPVRKQSALKSASKTLFSIKALLKKYAFARGTTRFSLKVLKGKNDKAHWQYSPVSNSQNLAEVAKLIVGYDVASRCEYRASVFSPVLDEITGGEYSVQALLAGFEDDTLELNNVGHFISIDGRPVSSTRGVMKEVVRLYRTYYRNSTIRASNSKLSSDPFLCMHFNCPRGSYDVNIEPTKDDILFMNPTFIMCLVDNLFKHFYGDLLSLNGENIVKNGPTVAADFEKPFTALLARRSPLVDFAEGAHLSSPNKPLNSTDHVTVTGTEHRNSKSERPFLSMDELSARDTPQLSSGSTRMISQATPSFEVHSNMYSVDHNEMFDSSPSSPSSQEIRDRENDATGSAATNPWAIAKLNATAERRVKADGDALPYNIQLLSPASGVIEGPSQEIFTRPNLHCSPLSSIQSLPTPTTSPQSSVDFQNPRPSTRHRAAALTHHKEGDSTLPNNAVYVGQRQGRAFDENFRTNCLGPRGDLPDFKRASELYEKQGNTARESQNDVHFYGVSEAKKVVDELLHDEGHSEADLRNDISRPFKSPVLKLPRTPDTDPDIPLPLENSGRRDYEATSLEKGASIGQHIHSRLNKELPRPIPSSNDDLEQIMDFERRKKVAIAQQRKAYAISVGRGANPRQPAQLQRASAQTSQLSSHPQSVDGPTSISETIEAYATPAFESRFGEGEAAPIMTYRSNLHVNRNVAAVQSLSRTNQVEDAERFQSLGVGQRVNELPQLSEDDPRSHLIRRQSQNQAVPGNDLITIGLKIRRTKTQLLPLESVPIGLALHDIVTLQPFAMPDVLSGLDMSNTPDSYVKTGKNRSLRWSFTDAEVDDWQQRLDTMINAIYRAKVGGNLITPRLEILLKRALKVHCDNI